MKQIVSKMKHKKSPKIILPSKTTFFNMLAYLVRKNVTNIW